MDAATNGCFVLFCFKCVCICLLLFSKKKKRKLFSLFIHLLFERWVSFFFFSKKMNWIEWMKVCGFKKERKNVYIENKYSIRSMMIILFWTGSRLDIDDDDDFAQHTTEHTIKWWLWSGAKNKKIGKWMFHHLVSSSFFSQLFELNEKKKKVSNIHYSTHTHRETENACATKILSKFFCFVLFQRFFYSNEIKSSFIFLIIFIHLFRA